MKEIYAYFIHTSIGKRTCSMKRKIPELTLEIRKNSGGHIFYVTQQIESYMENIVVFILDGLKNEDDVLIVENKRLTPLIKQRLESILTEKELARVHFFDSFTFYWKKGSFLPSAIVDHFREEGIAASLAGQRFRTWGHIEWSTQEDMEEEVIGYEEHVSQLIAASDLIAVCAYDADRIEGNLEKRLQKYHEYLMTDDQIVLCRKVEEL